MATPRFTLGGANGWPIKEGSVLAYEQTSEGLFKPAPFDVARNSGGSYVDANGLIQQEYRPNVPRITYSGGRACLMNEEARTNLLTYSEQFDNAAWSKSGGGTGSAPVVTANAATAPDGTTTADQIDFDRGAGNTASDLSQLFQSYSAVSGTEYQQTFYVKATTGADVGKEIGIRLAGTASFTIVTLTSEFQRVTHTETSTVTGARTYEIVSRGTVTTDNQVSIIIWGAQAEAGSYASSYIKTEGAAATRAAESIEGLNLGNFLGDSEGGLYVDASWFDISQTGYLSISDNTVSNRISLGINGGLQRWRLLTAIGGSNTVNIQPASATPSNNTFFKLAGVYALNDYALFANGSNLGEDLSAAVYPDGTMQGVTFSNSAGGEFPRGIFYEIQVFDQRPTNAEMEAQTT